MSVRRFVPIAAAVLAASLAACNPSATKSESDSKLAASASAGTDRAEAGSSAAPGAPAGGNGLSLSEAIAKLPAADEVRDGYKRDSFKHWVDEDGDSCSTRNEVLLTEAVKAPEQGGAMRADGR